MLCSFSGSRKQGQTNLAKTVDWLMQHSEILGAFMDNEPLLSDHPLSCECVQACVCVCVCGHYMYWRGVCVCLCAPVTDADNRCLLCSFLPTAAQPKGTFHHYFLFSARYPCLVSVNMLTLFAMGIKNPKKKKSFHFAIWFKLKSIIHSCSRHSSPTVAQLSQLKV